MFGLGKKNVSEKKLREWQRTMQLEKIFKAAKTGNLDSRLRAIAVLQEVNMIVVKRNLLALLEDENKNVALRAAEALEHMGAVPAERTLIEACRKKHAPAAKGEQYQPEN